MQSKLIVASLAALANQARAISTQSSAQAAETPAESLIGIYENCKVSVDVSGGTTATLNDQLQIVTSYDFTGIDENCPDMNAQVWLEPPPACNDDPVCSQLDKVEYTIVNPTNGKQSHTFDTAQIAGVWTTHIVVTPSGFECAMPITDACSSVDLAPVCAARLTLIPGQEYVGQPTINNPIGETNTYVGPQGLKHEINFDVANLWGCNLCAVYTADPCNPADGASGNMNFSELINFMNAPDSARILFSPTAYSPISYSVELQDCTTGDTIYGPLKSDDVPSPHPICDVEGKLTVDDWAPSGADGQSVTIGMSFENKPTYSCGQSYLTSHLTNNGIVSQYLGDYLDNTVSSPWSNLPFNKAETLYETFVATWPSPVDYDHMELHVEAEIPVWHNWDGCDANATLLKTFNADYIHYPPNPPRFCSYDVLGTTIDFSIVPDGLVGEHQIKLDTTSEAQYSHWCPEFTSSVEIFNKPHGSDVDSLIITLSLLATEVETFPGTVNKTYTGDFKDGTWCAQTTLTPASGSSLPAKTGPRVCTKVVIAPECVITPSCSLVGALLPDQYIMEFSQKISFTVNEWCNVISFEYDYTHKNFDQEDEQFGSDHNSYQKALQKTKQFVSYQEYPEQDFEVSTHFTVTETIPLFTSQTPALAECRANFTYELSCRPAFTYAPYLAHAEQGITFQIMLQTDTVGVKFCNDLFANVTVYDKNDVIVHEQTLNSAEVLPYALDKETQESALELLTIMIDDNDGCYTTKITYGDSTHVSAQLTSTITEVCIIHYCILDEPTFSVKDIEVDTAGNVLNWTFDYSFIYNKWCDVTNTSAALTAATSVYKSAITENQLTYTTQELATSQSGSSANQNYTRSGEVEVQQTGSFDISSFTADLLIANTLTIKVTANLTHDFIKPKPFCVNTISNVPVATTDTLQKVKITQTVVVTHGAVCGTPSYGFSSETATDLHEAGAIVTSSTGVQQWSLPAVTNNYTFNAHAYFSNFESDTYSAQAAEVVWKQGCQVQVTDLTLSFSAADNNTATTASAGIYANGELLGDCSGNDEAATFTIVATLCTTNATQPCPTIDIPVSAFNSTAGWTGSMEIARTSKNYTLKVCATATNADSREIHQLFTTGDGFNNILNDCLSTTGTSDKPLCDVSISDFKLVSYAEQSDNNGPVVATYQGTVTAEKTCKGVSANLKLIDCDNNIVKTTIPVADLVFDGGYSYTFTQEITGPNVKTTYKGKLIAFDSSNEADQAIALVDCTGWDPPCYLDVTSFTKSSATQTADYLTAQITYNLKISALGDGACEKTKVTVTMSDSTPSVKFSHLLLADDIKTALQTTGFTFTVAMDAKDATTAGVTVSDPRAVSDATGTALGWEAPATPLDCTVNVQDFCLTGATDNGDGTWNFVFTIRAASNSMCGDLSTTLEVISEDKYLPLVTIPDNGIVSAFDCKCDKEFTVTGEFAGAPGDVYGQLDIRNEAHAIIEMVDSGSFTIQ